MSLLLNLSSFATFLLRFCPWTHFLSVYSLTHLFIHLLLHHHHQHYTVHVFNLILYRQIKTCISAICRLFFLGALFVCFVVWRRHLSVPHRRYDDDHHDHQPSTVRFVHHESERVARACLTHTLLPHDSVHSFLTQTSPCLCVCVSLSLSLSLCRQAKGRSSPSSQPTDHFVVNQPKPHQVRLHPLPFLLPLAHSLAYLLCLLLPLFSDESNDRSFLIRRPTTTRRASLAHWISFLIKALSLFQPFSTQPSLVQHAAFQPNSTGIHFRTSATTSSAVVHHQPKHHSQPNPIHSSIRPPVLFRSFFQTLLQEQTQWRTTFWPGLQEELSPLKHLWIFRISCCLLCRLLSRSDFILHEVVTPTRS